MWVAVLSLGVIIASAAVRSLTTPVTFGGSNVGLPGDQMVESSVIGTCSRSSSMFAESAWRSASQSTKVLIALATNSMRLELSSATNGALRLARGAEILNATSPGRFANNLTTCAGFNERADAGLAARATGEPAVDFLLD